MWCAVSSFFSSIYSSIWQISMKPLNIRNILLAQSRKGRVVRTILKCMLTKRWNNTLMYVYIYACCSVTRIMCFTMLHPDSKYINCNWLFTENNMWLGKFGFFPKCGHISFDCSLSNQNGKYSENRILKSIPKNIKILILMGKVNRKRNIIIL